MRLGASAACWQPALQQQVCRRTAAGWLQAGACTLCAPVASQGWASSAGWPATPCAVEAGSAPAAHLRASRGSWPKTKVRTPMATLTTATDRKEKRQPSMPKGAAQPALRGPVSSKPLSGTDWVTGDPAQCYRVECRQEPACQPEARDGGCSIAGVLAGVPMLVAYRVPNMAPKAPVR